MVIITDPQINCHNATERGLQALRPLQLIFVKFIGNILLFQCIQSKL